ncbi:PREDICTED: uncharacterized protein LOC105144205 isoform X2 [Acromyrmex echinatior]|uniref:uncharacterized protein LOC105144205 isoform X2 n=1 Tax=Acromyrmex echinatior TaxID=103372 RepID=UPI000580DB1A|nr:PREDICTED: uncharacterized protein LOC105144205 isoform X2 [Acromyrmex echinatior]
MDVLAISTVTRKRQTWPFLSFSQFLTESSRIWDLGSGIKRENLISTIVAVLDSIFDDATQLLRVSTKYKNKKTRDVNVCTSWINCQ